MISWKDRERIKAKEKIRRETVPKTKKFDFSYSTVTSTVALIVSAMTAYYNIFYVHRSIFIALTPDVTNFSGASGDNLISYTAVISNEGNHYETILSLTLILGDPDSYRSGITKGPYILKGGESLPIDLSFLISDDVRKTHHEKKNTIMARIAYLARKVSCYTHTFRSLI